MRPPTTTYDLSTTNPGKVKSINVKSSVPPPPIAHLLTATYYLPSTKIPALWIFLGLLAYMPLHILLSTWLGTTFALLDLAKILKDIVLVAGFLLITVASIGKPWFKGFLSDKLIWLIGAYALLTLLLAVIKPTDTDAEVLAVVYNLRFFVFFIYGLLLTYHFNINYLVRRALQVALGVGLVVLIFGFIQYMWLPDDALTHIGYARENGVLPAFHIDDKPDLERIMSTLRDPNSLGSYILIILAFALTYLLKLKNKDLRRMAVGLLALSLLCLWFTFSRGAWIGAGVTVTAVLALYFKQGQRLRFNKKLFIILLTIVAISAGTVYMARDTYFVKNVVLHADESTVLEDPNQLRMRFWQESLDAAIENPLGYGPGTAGLASVRNEVQGTILNENYYFQLLHEVGVIGLVLFLVIIAIVSKRLYELANQDPIALALLASFLGLAVTNLLVHIWANEAVAYTWWGLAGVVLATVRNRRPTG